MDIDRIVDVTITKQTATPSIASFSDILIASEFLTTDITPVMGATERVRSYGTLADVATAFGTSSNQYKMAAAIFSQNPAPDKVLFGRKLTGVDGTETWTEALTAIALENPNWYGLLAITRTLADQQTISAWVASNERLCVLASDDANIPDGTGDIAEYLQTNSNGRVGAIYDPNSDLSGTENWPDAAWLGVMFPKDPGSANWAFKTLIGVTPTTLTETQKDTIEGKNGNYYTSISDINVTQFGTVGDGEYFDIVRGLDWLKARIQQLVFTTLVNNDKVAYDDGGIQSIVGQVKAALQEAVDIQLINPDFTVTAPLAADVSATDKGNRFLPDVDFIAVLTGAINTVQVNGTVSF